MHIKFDPDLGSEHLPWNSVYMKTADVASFKLVITTSNDTYIYIVCFCETFTNGVIEQNIEYIR